MISKYANSHAFLYSHMYPNNSMLIPVPSPRAGVFLDIEPGPARQRGGLPADAEHHDQAGG